MKEKTLKVVKSIYEVSFWVYALVGVIMLLCATCLLIWVLAGHKYTKPTQTEPAKTASPEKELKALPYFKINEELRFYDEFAISYDKYDNRDRYLGIEAGFVCKFSNGKILDGIMSYGNNDVGEIYLTLVGEKYKLDSLYINISDKYGFDIDCGKRKNLLICGEEQKEADKWLKTLEVKTRVQKLINRLGNVKQHLSFPAIDLRKLRTKVDTGPPNWTGIDLDIDIFSLNANDWDNYAASFRYFEFEDDIFPFENYLAVKNDLGYNTGLNLDKNGNLTSISYVLDNTYTCGKNDAVCQRAQKTVDYWRGIMKWDAAVEKQRQEKSAKPDK